MKFLKIISILILTALTSCMTAKQVTIDEAYIAKYGFIMAKPKLAEITVDRRKIDGKAIVQNKIYGKESVISAAKKLAVIDAVKKANVDIIVQPIFQVETDSKYTTATVTGFAGKYKNFRDITLADTTAFWLRKQFDNYAGDIAVPTEKVITKKGQ